MSTGGTGGAGRALVVGECLVDLAPAFTGAAGAGRAGGWAEDYRAMPGGGPANVAVGMVRLGVPTAFAGRFSRGGFGPWLRGYLESNGLDLAFSVDADEPATLALVTLDSDGRASYTFYGPGTADWQWDADELPDLSAAQPDALGVSAVHTGSLALALDPGAAVLAGWLVKLRRGDQVLISFDPNVRPGFLGDISAYRERLSQIASSAHVIKASTDDLQVIYPGTTPLAAAEQWLSEGASLVVITEGPDGATAFHRSGARAHLSPPAIEVADTIGAGDSFTAALLAYFARHGLLNPPAIATLSGAHLEGAMAQAVAASALTCARPGADPPTEGELSSFISGQAP